MKNPKIGQLEIDVDIARRKLEKARKRLYEAQDVDSLKWMYAECFDSEVVQSALALISSRKKATLQEIKEYFRLSRSEEIEIEKAIDFEPLNFIHTSRSENEVMFEWDCPRLWQEYKAGNGWFTREMLDKDIKVAIDNSRRK
jgi:hypothetical protein